MALDKAVFLWKRLQSRGMPPYFARAMLVFTSVVLSVSVKQTEMEATKAAVMHSAVMNSAKADPSAASVPVSASLDDTEMKKVLEKCKRQQAEIDKLAEENRQLKVSFADKHRHKPRKVVKASTE